MYADRQENIIHDPARGVAGKTVSHTGHPIHSTQPGADQLHWTTGTPYSDAIHRHVHRKSDHMRAETHIHTLQNACGGGGGGEAGRMERRANEKRSE